MIYGLKLSGEAEADLADIMAYISMDAPERAERFVDLLLDKIRSLCRMPRRCPVAPEGERHGRELRHLIYGAYRILFTIEGKNVIVIRVLHGARKWN